MKKSVTKKAKSKKKPVETEIARNLSRTAFKKLLERIAEGVNEKSASRIMINGNRITIPANAKVSVEYEVDGSECELELQFSWKN